MSLLKRNGGGNNNKSKRNDEEGEGISDRATRQQFRKSASIDPSISDSERPHSQQSSRGGGGGRRKNFSNFLSNLFGNPKISEDELSPPPPPPPPCPGPSNLSGKNSTSHESVNSVLSSSSFSFVNPKKYSGKGRKGKRIPVDDPNYGKTGEGRNTLGAAIGKIGAKIGLKKKYNLQSCESLQYIDACCDSDVSQQQSNKDDATNHAAGSAGGGVPPATNFESEKSKKSPENSTTAAELSAECQAITRHYSQEGPAFVKSKKQPSTETPPKALDSVVKVSPETNDPTPQPPSSPSLKELFLANSPHLASSRPAHQSIKESNSVQSTKITSPAPLSQSSSSHPPQKVSSGTQSSLLWPPLVATASVSPNSIKPLGSPPPLETSPTTSSSTTGSSSGGLSTTFTPSNISQPPHLEQTSPPPSDQTPKLISSVETQQFSSVKVSTPAISPKEISSSPAKPLESSTTPPTSSSEESKPQTISTVTQSTSSSSSSQPLDSRKDIQSDSNPFEIESSAISESPSVSKVTPSKEPNPPLPIASTSNASASISEASNNPSPPSPVPCCSTSTSAKLLNGSGSNTWGNSNRRKRRAPQPPSVDNPTQKYSNGLTPLKAYGNEFEDIPNHVPTSSSRAAALTRFNRITESPIREKYFEIRPRKKERSVEPSPVIRPTIIADSNNENSNALLSLRRLRYQRQVRACSESKSESYSTDTRGRVHKPGKKKAPPPPNPFGDPDVPEESEDVLSAPSSRNLPLPTVSPSEEQPVPGNSSTTSASATTSSSSNPPVPEQRRKSLCDRPPIAKMTTSVSITKAAAPPPPPPATVTPPEHATATESFTTSRVTPTPALSVVSQAAVTESTSTTTTTVTITPIPTPTAIVPNDTPQEPPAPSMTDCSADVLEEIRQNILNDQQERAAQLGMISSSPPSTDEEVIIPATVPTTSTSNHSNSSSTQSSPQSPSCSRSNPPRVSENEMHAAIHTLDVLSASIKDTKKSTTPDPTSKAKLTELKKEADKASSNVPKSKVRPASMGSSIYESPLALLLGKSSNNGTTSATEHSSAENSPRVTPKPWYKRSASSAFAKQLISPKSKPASSVKPFTSLVKFSELDKEAGRIVEENRRKSAEQRFNENAQELMALFSSSFPEAEESAQEVPIPTTTSPQESIRPTPSETTTTTAATSYPSQLSSSQITKISITAQVHPISEENIETTSPARVSANIFQGKNSTTSTLSTQPGESAPRSTSAPSSSTSTPPIDNSGSSSPPTFQSVHAASKHRQIKPLLTSSSPLTSVRSEKLAIVQPQTSQSSSGGSASVTTATTTTRVVSTTTSPMLPIVSNARVTSAPSTTSTTISVPLLSSTTTSQVVTLSSSPTTARSPTAPAPATSSPLSRPGNDPQWDCPRCTLKNPNWRILCEICFQRKDPIVSSNYISSILQRVNAESSSTNKAAVSSTSNSTISTVSSTTSTKVPSSIVASSSSSTVTTSSSITIPIPTPKPIESIPVAARRAPSPCENFLSQLPAKNDLTKEEKMQGMKLYEDPELEELDVGKLREARLAYFQRQTNPSPSENDESRRRNPTKKDASEQTQSSVTSNQAQAAAASVQNHKSSSSCKDGGAASHPTANRFADNDDDDDFIDELLELNVENLSGSTSPLLLPCPPWKAAPSPSSPPTSPILPNPRYRHRPRLEAIREGNSQDYTYCYSSTEIAQIYENWQAPSPSSPSAQRRRATHLLEQTSTPTTFHNLLELGNVYPVECSINLPVPVVDHQPSSYSNNRFADSSEEKYVNTSVGAGFVINPTTSSSTPLPPTLNERGQFLFDSCSTSSAPSCPPAHNQNEFPVFPHLAQVFVSNMSRNSSRYKGGGGGGQNNYENNTSFTPGGSGSSRSRMSYEDFRRMGAVPKGYPFQTCRNDDWSSESSCDTDSSRSFWHARGPTGYPEALFGMSRRGTLDFSQENGFPDQPLAVGNLMKRLEAAIANGDHRLAATLAHDLALMKVNCVVAKINQPFSIRVYVEDRFMQQGPFLIQVTAMMTVSELKQKIESDWGIPAGFQKWILGKTMAEDDNLSLSSFNMAQDSMGFLFLVTPDFGNVPRSGQGAAPVSDNIPKANNIPVSVDGPVLRNTSSSSDFGRKSKSPTPRHNNNIPPTYNNVSNGSSAPHVYNNLSGNGTVSPPPQPSPSCSKKASHNQTPKSKSVKNADNKQSSSSSTVLPNVTTAGKSSSSANKNESEARKKEESPPPPLPSRSPIPPPPTHQNIKKGSSTPSSTRAQSKTPEKVNLSLESKQKIVNKQPIKKASNSALPPATPPPSKPSNSIQETATAASAFTVSLQQKLAEFRAVAEQTFSKAGIATSIQSAIHSSKEPSPAPRSNKSDDQVKPSHRKGSAGSGKGKLALGSSREKLTSSSASGSTEKLVKAESDKEKVKENRFNGVLLPTAKDNENLVPPERSDKSKEGAVKQRPPKATKSSTSAEVPGSSKTKSQSTTQQVDLVDPENSASPAPVEKEKQSSSDIKVDEGEIVGVAPQPKPRGLKKQSTIEKATHQQDTTDDESTSSLSTNPPAAPKPVPRTMSPTKARRLSGAKSPEPILELKEVPKSPEPSVSAAVPPSQGGEIYPKTVAIDDYCQTTLPFPAPKPRINPEETGGGGGSSLLRPSAFVTQSNGTTSYSQSVFKSGPRVGASGTTVLLPNFEITTNTPTTSVSHVTPSTSNIAHVQPTPIAKSPPTAYVSPSPASVVSSSSSSSAGAAPKKSKEDNVDSYLKMVELMEKQDLIYTTQDAECPVCFANCAEGEGIVLRDCLHIFCKECLVGCVQYADDTTVKCPYRDSDYACNYNLQEREIKALVPSDVFEKYLARSVKLAESKIVNTFHCKTPDCTGWCVFEDDVNVFLCPVCKKRNCLTCAAIHEGIDCLKFQRELAIAAETDEDAKQSRLMLEKMIQRGEALECPACHVVLLKKWGCDWVRCSYCKTEICWVTKGFRWGKGGKGDVSGGCKCGVNGVKCHPKCTYCH